jgi:D-serine deaminase-like pyridoxal phosphate-dependent protein
MLQQRWVGVSSDFLGTPVLVVDLPALDRNIATVAATCRNGGKVWRPHTKGFTVPQIAQRAIEAGAVGVTCATLCDAEVMVAAGITDIMIANQVVGSDKLSRLARLCRVAKVSVAVDDPAHVWALAAAAAAAGVTIGLLIEVDIGIHRAGTAPGRDAVNLAAQITSSPNLRFLGLMGWEGHTCPIEPPDAKRAEIARAIGAINETAEMCREAGIAVETISCGGTGTFPITAQLPGVTEIQAGGGLLCDVRYRTRYGVTLDPALTMLTTVTSRPTDSRIICDGGKKTMSDHPVLPRPLGLDPVDRVALSAEHITVELSRPQTLPRIGDKLAFEVSYVDLTMPLHEVLFATRDNVVEAVWPVHRSVIGTHAEGSVSEQSLLPGTKVNSDEARAGPDDNVGLA